jgi:aminoglycoside phosphotransferase (APT) family kinase protein
LPVNTVTVIDVSITTPNDDVKPTELAEVLVRLRELDSPNLDLTGSPQRLSGGFWAEMWVLSLRDHGPGVPDRVVLRLSPDADLAAWETIVQRGVADQGYPTPRIIASGPATPSSRFWSVMEHACGTPLLAGLSGIKALGRLPTLARSLPDQLAQVAARLHALDASTLEHELAETTGRRVGVAGLLDHYATTASEVDDQLLTRAVDLLRADRPEPARRVICHGDLHPFNVLADHDELIVLDWTAAQVADPAYDLAFTALLIEHPPLHAPNAIQPVIRAAARALSRRFIRSYNAAADHPVDSAQLQWHTRLHAVRILTDLRSWHAAGTKDEHAGHPWFAMEPQLRSSIALSNARR